MQLIDGFVYLFLKEVRKKVSENCAWYNAIKIEQNSKIFFERQCLVVQVSFQQNMSEVGGWAAQDIAVYPEDGSVSTLYCCYPAGLA